MPTLLACMNSMDYAAIVFARTFWVDLASWVAGGLFLNGVVLANVRGVEGEAPPSRGRRAFFLLVGLCVVLLIGVTTAAGPLLGVNPDQLAICTINASVLTLLIIGPVTLFWVQALFFQGLKKVIFGEHRKLALGALAFSSVLLVLAMTAAKDTLSPDLCVMPKGGPVLVKANDGY